MSIPIIRTIAGVASFGVLIPTPVTVAVGVAGVATFTAVRKGAKRPSDALRMVEDGVSNAASRVVRGAKDLSTRVRTEYAARKIDLAQREIEATVEQLMSMTPAELAAYDEAQAQITRRVDELRAARRAKD